jgi:alpha-L-fucosidase
MSEPQKPPVDWGSLTRPVPSWFTEAKFGIFIHWGAYSVPAWAEPVGELGAVEERVWFQHNPYAEWYWNTVRFEDSPARQHHRENYQDAPYDDFLDAWDAAEFDPADWAKLFAEAGARYVVPTTKHHDGIALWDAPGTGTRNTVRRGPHRDLVSDLEVAVRTAGLRFGVYYSGGLDWSVTNLPVIDTHAAVRAHRPLDAAYAAYAYLHVKDLIDRYRPDVLWNDIEWPDGGKHGLSLGLFQLMEHYYRTVPEGVVNDRWGDTHWDFKTSEYQYHLDSEQSAVWENCRGIGLSFGYNQVESAAHLLDGDQLVKHLVDVVSRGGNLLLNVGPTAGGLVPPGQRAPLEHLAAWMKLGSEAIYGTRPVPTALAEPSEAPWARWTQKSGRAWAIVDASGTTELRARPEAFELRSATLATGQPLAVWEDNGRVLVDLPLGPRTGPAVVSFNLAGRHGRPQ